MRGFERFWRTPRRTAGLLTLAFCGLCSCQSTPSQAPAPGGTTGSITSTSKPGQPLGEVTQGERVGREKMNLEQVQAEVEAFADRYVLRVAQATDQASNQAPEARERLHALKLAVGRGAYISAAGPNPVVSLLDLIVQSTLVRSSVERHLAQTLPEDAAAPLLDTLARLQDEAWGIGQRVLAPQELADLRTLIDSWIAENPNVVYVAGIRFADFARLRPKESTSLPSSIFGLLRIDPFASIDPAAREIHESRLLAERIFFSLQRMPQLLQWQTEAAFYDVANAASSQRLLNDLEEFTATAKTMTDAVQRTPRLVRQELEQGAEPLQALLQQTDESLGAANQTLVKIDETASNLRDVSEAAAEAGRAWEGAVSAARDIVTELHANGEAGAAAPEAKPVTVQDVIAALQNAQVTAEQLRGLVTDLNTAAREGVFRDSVETSVTETRRAAQSVVVTATICGLALIAAAVAGGLFYRAKSRQWQSADASRS